MLLFRPEAMRGQDRLHGEVVLVPPVSWHMLAGFFLLAVVAAGLFLSLAEYSKTTSVSGQLTGSRGVIRAVPPRPGRIETLLVKEGQQVAAGTPLARIAVSISDGAASLEERRSAAIARRDEILTQRGPDVAGALQARMSGLRARIEADRLAIASITAQIGEQRALVDSATQELALARSVAERGFVSGHDVRQREERLATRRQALSRLDQELSAHRASILVAQSDLARAQTEHDLQMADIAAGREELAGLAAANENARSIVVTAAQGGTVTGIVVNAGDAVRPERPILSIIPAGTRLQARIEVPPEAAGLIAAGQSVRLAVDAFPYQIYGTVEAVVDTVSMTTVPVVRADGSAGEAFLVRASLRSDAVKAYGRPQPLRPGMTFSARIKTRSRSLAEWLFDPLFAVGRR